jgi:hypothetical protein
MEEGEKIEATLTGEDIRLIHSMSDFQQALSAITFIDELEPDQKMTKIELRRYRCIEDAAVVAYWRPFSECNGLPKLSLKKLGLKPSPAENKLHEELRVHRNKVVAHTDIERMTFSFAAWRAFDDRDIFMPHLVRNDSLALFDRRHEWMGWVRKLNLTVAKLVFERAQVLGEAAFLFVPDA